MKRFFPAFAVAALAIVLTVGLVWNQRAEAASAVSATAAVVGQPAPDFTLTDEAGNPHHLADYKGSVVVLEWTNPECPFVARHYKIDTMERLSAKYAEKVVWLAVDSSHFNKPADSNSWKAKQGFAYPVLQDPDGAIGRLYGARTTPHMFVVDQNGVLRYNGAIDDDAYGRSETTVNYVGDAVSALIAGTDPAVATTKPYGCSVKYSRK